MSNIFISYRHVEPDDSLAQKIAKHLIANRHDVFIDTRIRVGTKWAEEIERRLQEAEFFVILISADSILSDMLRREVQMAHAISNSPEGKLVILPVRVRFEDALPYDLGSYLDPIQYTVWNGDDDDERLLNDLKLAVEQAAALPNSGPDSEGEEKPGHLDGLYASTEKIGAPLPASDPRLAADLRMDTGAVKSTSPFYVEREADPWLLRQILSSGSTSIVKGARQTGKSSLLARAHNTAKKDRKKSFYLDFQLLDEAVLKDLDSLCRHLALKISTALRVEIKPSDTWEDLLGPKDNLTDYIEQALLADADTPVLLIFDEADRIFEFPYRDDFFGLIRAWHNRRSIEEAWDNLNIVIAHATEPYLWIQDINQSPFNVGDRRILKDFQIDQVTQLNSRHGSPLKSTVEIGALYDMVGGRPYLVRQALFTMASRSWSIKMLEENAIDDRGPFGDHLRWYIWCLHRYADLNKAIKQIIRENRCENEMDFLKLKATGLIKGATRQDVRMRCRLYSDYFGKHL